MLVYSKPLVKKAEKMKYAIGAFNVFNIETTLAVVKALEDLKSPGIIQISESTLTKYLKADQLIPSVLSIIKKSKVPIALHLDHGKSIDVVKLALKSDFTSIMFDGSLLPLDKNIKLTKKVVKMVKKKNNRITVEGEIGIIGENKVHKDFLTNPEEAKLFAEETGVDMLAISIGNAHGLYKKKPNLNFRRLKEIRKVVKIPLVLHGGSGIPNDQIRKAIRYGISKINVFTELKLAFREGMKKQMKEKDPRKILLSAKDEMEKVVKEKIRLFGSENKAKIH